MSTLPFNLVGDADILRDRLVVQVELDARTGELLSITGDRDAIRRTCSFLLEAVGAQGTRHGLDHGDGNRPIHGLGAHTACGNGPLPDTVTNMTANVEAVASETSSDRELRHRARPANILAALRRERELPSAALRLVEDECERELHSTSTSLETSAWDRELPTEVARRDERTMESASFDPRQNSDARSGGHGSAAGPRTERLHLNDIRELVSRHDALEASGPDAFPPRSPGEGHLARGFAGESVGNAGQGFAPGETPVGGVSVGNVGDAGDWCEDRVTDESVAAEGFDGSASNLVRGAGRDRSGLCDRSRRTFVTGAGGALRLVPSPHQPPAAGHDHTDGR